MRKMLIAAAVLIAGGMTETAATPSQEADRWALENAREIGEPENCIQLNRIRSSKVRSGDVIDFEMIDGRIMRSRLPHRCPGLSFEERFSYSTSLSRLCSVDTITVFDGSGMRGASCGLGRFQQVEIAER
jgi:hypothetical protein